MKFETIRSSSKSTSRSSKSKSEYKESKTTAIPMIDTNELKEAIAGYQRRRSSKKSSKSPREKTTEVPPTSGDDDLHVINVLTKYIENHSRHEEMLYRSPLPAESETKEIVRLFTFPEKFLRIF